VSASQFRQPGINRYFPKIAYEKADIPRLDVWFNTPQPPFEASGTNGMKAALNGLPNFPALSKDLPNNRIASTLSTSTTSV
jgi:hypothetical protein